jgi:hypothetical protein
MPDIDEKPPHKLNRGTIVYDLNDFLNQSAIDSDDVSD